MKPRFPKLLLPFSLGLMLVAVFLLSSAGLSGISLAAPQACVPGPHSGVITGTQQWCTADSPHLLSGDVTVPSGMPLTAETGAIVQGANRVELLV